MYGAIIGDIVGSVYEFNNIKTKKFPLFSERSIYTDDSIMTIAVAKSLMESRDNQSSFKKTLIKNMREYGRKYPHAGYGGMFAQWLASDNPVPYNSFGNGSAMRVSPCGLIAVTLQEALDLARASAEVTHNHPEGIKGAQATAAAIFLAKTGKSKDEIKEYIEGNFYKLSATIDEIRPEYHFNETCQNTVPQAILAFLESDDYEDAIRNAVSLGGDSDTLAAITGSIAWAFYRRNISTLLEEYAVQYSQLGYALSKSMEEAKNKAATILPNDIVEFIKVFDELCVYRAGAYERIGIIKRIPL